MRHTFTGVNRGDRPLVILDVTTTCGCTVPRFSKRPVLPGDRTEITVSYDPTNRPGAFDKELWIYSSDRKRIATLTIRGEVVPRAKSVEELYPVDAGGGLRLNTTLCAFTYIYPGVRMQSSVGYVNTSDRTVSLELRPDPAIRSGLLRIDAPERIAPGARGAINISYLVPADTPVTARCATRWSFSWTAAAAARRSWRTASERTTPPTCPRRRHPGARYRPTW